MNKNNFDIEDLVLKIIHKKNEFVRKNTHFLENFHGNLKTLEYSRSEVRDQIIDKEGNIPQKIEKTTHDAITKLENTTQFLNKHNFEEELSSDNVFSVLFPFEKLQGEMDKYTLIEKA